MDKKAQVVGTIQDVFGPVKTPYISIRPKSKDNASKLIGQPLYLHQRWTQDVENYDNSEIPDEYIYVHQCPSFPVNHR